MKQLFDDVSYEMSKLTTKRYSTSFSLGISFLHGSLHKPIYGVYGFVRFADEIVDSFHGFNKEELLADFKKQTYIAIDQGISLNPILNSFQSVVREYNIPLDLIETFLNSM
ncbi:MAG: phytoene/squalene synthase family protein, partial [Flavobacteriia bacterium]